MNSSFNTAVAPPYGVTMFAKEQLVFCTHRSIPLFFTGMQKKLPAERGAWIVGSL